MAISDNDVQIDSRIEYLGDLAFDGEFRDALNDDEFPDEKEAAKAFQSEHRAVQFCHVTAYDMA